MSGCSRRLRRRRPPRDDRGGAISLWVVLMVPVSAFAAVAAMAGPQRLAAESSVQEAADDLAAFAVAWRDGQRLPGGQLNSFPPDCAARTDQQTGAIAALGWDIDNAVWFDDGLQTRFENLLGEFKQPPPQPRLVTPVEPEMPDPDDPDYLADPGQYVEDQQEYVDEYRDYVADHRTALQVLGGRLDSFDERLDGWDEACGVLLDSMAADLGNLGVDVYDLRGAYSDSLDTSGLTGQCTLVPPEAYPDRHACEAANGMWIASQQYALPCRTGEATVVLDGVHVAISAEWRYAGWAAAQVWPDGIPMAAESAGRLTQRRPSADPECGDHVVLFDPQGRPVWSGQNNDPPSRQLVQSVGRSTLTG